MISRTTICIIILFISSYTVKAQEFNEKQIFHDLLQPTEHNHDYQKIAEKGKNKVAGALFLFYKSFFSSQDINACVFEPSCSVYAVKAIQKKGFLLGIFMATDRLMRCNRFSPELYKLNKNNLFIDDIK